MITPFPPHLSSCARMVVTLHTNSIPGNERLTISLKENLQMGKCCSDQILKNQRRVNGLQLPLNWQQSVSWIVLLITGFINFLIVSRIQFNELKVVTIIIFVILYLSHISSHVAALIIDPAEEDLRNRETYEVPEFDRNLHAHVIENGRCHLCNIYTSNKKTKHCGLCNKCVYEFDHHCKWLNNCIGQRNYFAFIGCVTTALLISTFTFVLCILDIIWFFNQPQLLSTEAHTFYSCNSTDTINIVKFCQSSISFLIFLIILTISGIAMTCALLHLCCFHMYISLLGVSTYEYIVKNSNSNSIHVRCCRINCKKKTYLFQRNIEKDLSHDVNTGDSTENKNNVNALNILINSEFNRAIKILSTDNKVHPHQDKEIS